VAVLEAPRNLGEIFSHLSALMYKNGQSAFFVENIAKTLKDVVFKNQLHLDALEVDHMMNSILLALQSQASEKKDKESAKDGEKKSKAIVTNILSCSCDLIQSIIAKLSNSQKKQLIDCVKATLEKKFLIMHMDTVEQFTPQFNSVKDKLKVSSMISSHEQVELCLRAYGTLLSNLDESLLLNAFQNEVEMLTPLLPYLKDDKIKASTQKEAKKVVSNLASKLSNLNWIQNLLYQFLQLITIENADILTLQHGDQAKVGDKKQSAEI